MRSLTVLPTDLKLSLTKSATIGLHPPQPVVAFVALATDFTVSLPSCSTEQHIAPLVTPSQEHITAVSGKSMALPKAEPPPAREPTISSSALSGNGIPFKNIWCRIL